MESIRKDLFTVPNVLTFGRLLASPAVTYYMYKQPRKAWPVALAFAVSDNVDGILARMGDTHPELARCGFRRSEIGRKADPFVDKIFTTEIVLAGMANGVIPKWLGALSLAQKGIVSGLTLLNEAQGIELEVTKLGKRSEFATNLAIGTLFIAESIEDEERKQQVRTFAVATAIGGIAGASLAAYGYHTQARAMRQLLSAAEDPGAEQLFMPQLSDDRRLLAA